MVFLRRRDLGRTLNLATQLYRGPSPSCLTRGFLEVCLWKRCHHQKPTRQRIGQSQATGIPATLMTGNARGSTLQHALLEDSLAQKDRAEKFRPATSTTALSVPTADFCPNLYRGSTLRSSTCFAIYYRMTALPNRTSSNLVMCVVMTQSERASLITANSCKGNSFPLGRILQTCCFDG